MEKYKKCKRKYQKYQQTIESFDKLSRKNLQKILLDKNEYASRCNTFIEYLRETKMNVLYILE